MAWAKLEQMDAIFRPDFTSKLVRELAFGTPKFYIAPYDKINHGLVNMSSNCDVKSGVRALGLEPCRLKACLFLSQMQNDLND